MKATTFFLILVAFFATIFASPILCDYVERAGYDQNFGELEARNPTPARRVRVGGDNDDNTASASAAGPTSTTTDNFAPTNMANLASVGVMAFIAGAVAIF